MLSMGLVRSSKVTAKGLVIALAAGLLGTGVVIIGAASPASATSCGTGSTNPLYSGTAGQDGSSTTTAYRISTPADLIRISNTTADWTGKFFLQTADIDLGGCEWTPIGTPANKFSGHYDGGGFSIVDLLISTSSSDSQGLFGEIWASSIKNLKVQGSITSNRQSVGGLVGEVVSSATLSTRISKVRSEVDITYLGSGYAGGIAGEFMEFGGIIEYSSFSGSISNSTNRQIGGFLGFAGAPINSSYSTVSFGGTTTFKGGFGGWNTTRLTKSYSVPINADGGISTSLATLTGLSFWDTTVGPATSGRLSTSVSANAIGKTSSEMKSSTTYRNASWDIVDGWEVFSTTSSPPKIWGICSQANDGYPFLLWEYTTDPCTTPATPVVNNPPTSSAPAMSVPSSEVLGVSLSAGAMPNQTLVQVRLTKTPTSLEQFFIVVRLLDLQGVLIRELRVPVEPSTSFVEIPVDKRMGQFNVVALTSNAAGATAAVSFDPQTVKQRVIRKATENAPRRLTGKSLNRDVVFTADSAALSAQMKRTLRQAARLAKASDSRVAVTGFAAASPKGTKFEKRLAERRALRVANFLRKQGLENWIYFHGLNSRKGSDFAGQPRRVEIRVLK